METWRLIKNTYVPAITVQNSNLRYLPEISTITPIVEDVISDSNVGIAINKSGPVVQSGSTTYSNDNTGIAWDSGSYIFDLSSGLSLFSNTGEFDFNNGNINNVNELSIDLGYFSQNSTLTFGTLVDEDINPATLTGIAQGGNGLTLDFTSGILILPTATINSLIVATDMQMGDGINMQIGGGTGTKIGTATSQKIAFWNATPIARPTTSVTSSTFVVNSGTAINSASTFDGYTIAQIVKSLRNMGLLA